MSPKTHLTATVTAAVALMLAPLALAAESPAVLLEKGMFAEQTKGDLDEAVSIYQQIVDDADASGRHVAEALYRLGLCHEKKDDKAEAIAAFDRVLRQYPQQKTIAAKARAELGKLRGPPTFLPLGKVVERTVNDDGVGTESLIDLDTGKLFSPKGQAWKAYESTRAWFEAAGIDCGAETAVRAPGIWGLDMIVIPMATEQWEKISLDGIRDDIERGKPGSPVVMSALGDLPRTYAFKTREGSVGVLQILQVVNEPPRHIKIRYELVQHGAQPDARIRTAYIPDADTPDTPAVLDLATGQKFRVGSPQHFEQFKKLGKGDLAFDRALICLRGAKASLKEDGGLSPLEVVAKTNGTTAYELGEPPVRIVVETAEGREYEVTILSIKNHGINVEYRETKHDEATARRIAEQFLTAALAGRRSEAIMLTDPKSAAGHQVEELRRLSFTEQPRITSVHADDTVALAVTTRFSDDRDRKGQLTIRLIKQRGLWVVNDIDLETPKKATADLAEFLESHPDARQE